MTKQTQLSVPVFRYCRAVSSSTKQTQRNVRAYSHRPVAAVNRRNKRNFVSGRIDAGGRFQPGKMPHSRGRVVRREGARLATGPDHACRPRVVESMLSGNRFSIRTGRGPMTEDDVQRVRAVRERGLAKAREFFEELPPEQIEAMRRGPRRAATGVAHRSIAGRLARFTTRMAGCPRLTTWRWSGSSPHSRRVSRSPMASSRRCSASLARPVRPSFEPGCQPFSGSW